MTTTRVFAYETVPEAQLAVEHLAQRGVPKEDISVLVNNHTHGTHFDIAEKTKAPEGAGTGAAVGGVLGAIGATAAAIAGVTIPGVGFLAAGPIMTALAGAGAGGATGGVLGGLVGLGVSKHEAKFYEEVVEDGGVLLGVVIPDDERADIVREVQERTVPVRVSTN